MLRLGHIRYSNCFPVHALLVDRGAPEWIELTPGIPSYLNRLLSEGRLDVTPSSSIEYARNADRYRILPGPVIGARGAVLSILLESERAPESLDGEEVAIPTASATSVVLLRILLERRWGVRPRYRWFEQGTGVDPLGEGAAAALWIGDVALERSLEPTRPLLDLGVVWHEWTGLPFAFAVWQVAAGAERDAELHALHDLLRESRSYFEANAEALATRHAATYGLDAALLARYWRTLEYTLDDSVLAGLMRYYELAASLGVIPGVPELRWVTR